MGHSQATKSKESPKNLSSEEESGQVDELQEQYGNAYLKDKIEDFDSSGIDVNALLNEAQQMDQASELVSEIEPNDFRIAIGKLNAWGIQEGKEILPIFQRMAQAGKTFGKTLPEETNNLDSVEEMKDFVRHYNQVGEATLELANGYWEEKPQYDWITTASQACEGLKLAKQANPDMKVFECFDSALSDDVIGDVQQAFSSINIVRDEGDEDQGLEADGEGDSKLLAEFEKINPYFKAAKDTLDDKKLNNLLEAMVKIGKEAKGPFGKAVTKVKKAKDHLTLVVKFVGSWNESSNYAKAWADTGYQDAKLANAWGETTADTLESLLKLITKVIPDSPLKKHVEGIVSLPTKILDKYKNSEETYQKTVDNQMNVGYENLRKKPKSEDGQ
jgi:hypothetical protein